MSRAPLCSRISWWAPPLAEPDQCWRLVSSWLVMFTVCVCFLHRLPGPGDRSLCDELSQSPSSFRDHRGCHLLCGLGSLHGQIWVSDSSVPVSRPKATGQPLVLVEVVNALSSSIVVERDVSLSQHCSIDLFWNCFITDGILKLETT